MRRPVVCDEAVLFSDCEEGRAPSSTSRTRKPPSVLLLRYPDRLVVLFHPDDRYEVLTAPPTAERDAFIEDVVAAGRANRVHLHCPETGCSCTFPTMQLNDDGSAARRARGL
ncbi:MAG TPA: hypothetical protein VLT61_05220 [Anaeromyxobacteraceae bacterium]|nr:hypothetical protein [Anaeromyxobacteraceae bacterium]